MKPFLAFLVALSGILALTGSVEASTLTYSPCATKSPAVVLDKVWTSPCPSATASPSPTPSTKTSPTTSPTPTPTATPPPALQTAPTAEPAPPVTGDGSACCDTHPVASKGSNWAVLVGVVVGLLALFVLAYALVSRRLRPTR